MSVSLPDLAPLSSRSHQKTPQARLDAFRAAVSGPYDVDGQPVFAAPMFRAPDREIAPELVAERARIGRRAGFSERDLEALHFGAPSRAALVGMTQALIDAGKLPAGAGDIAQRIRALQWNYGIGFRADGFASEALRAAHRGRYGSEATRIALEDARPGDVIALGAAPGTPHDHEVVVYASRVSRGMRVVEVDASFAPDADGHRPAGYRREAWLFDEATGTWSITGVASSLIGPGAAPIKGVLRYTR